MAEKNISEDGTGSALEYLAKRIKELIKGGESDTAIACLDRAEQIISGATVSEHLFCLELRFVVINARLGRTNKAEEILSRVPNHIQDSPNPHSRDEIRREAVMTYLEMKRMEEALQLADTIEDPGDRFADCRDIALALEADAAERCLMEHCLPAALAGSDRFLTVSLLLHLAEDLIRIEKGESAKKVLDEVDSVKTTDREYRTEEWPKLWGRAAVMLIDLNCREEALALLSRGYLNEDHPSLHDPQELRRMRINEVKGRYPSLVQFFVVHLPSSS